MKELDRTNISEFRVDYPDGAVISLLSVGISFVLCFHGYQGQFMLEIMELPFLGVFGLFMFIAYLFLYYISYVVRQLDRQVPWFTALFNRAMYQFLWCWVVPAGAVFILRVLFTALLPLAVQDSGFLHTDMVFVNLVIALINAGYTLYFFMMVSQRQQTTIRKLLEENSLMATEIEAYQKDLDNEPETQIVDPYKEYIVLIIGGKEGKRPLIDIAYAHWYSDLPYVYLKDGTIAYGKPKTFKKLEAEMKGYAKLMYREYLVPPHSISKCIKLGQDRAKIILRAPFDNVEIKLSTKNFAELKDWLLDIVDIE